jgi:hypothetical protein
LFTVEPAIVVRWQAVTLFRRNGAGKEIMKRMHIPLALLLAAS